MRRRSILFAALLLPLAGCTPARDTFTTAWKRAVQVRDAKAVWALLDRATHEKILAGLRKSREKAAANASYAALRAAAAEPAPVDGGDEALALAFLAAQLDTSDPQLAEDGTNPRVHVEDGAWKITADPVGFVDPDGAALSLWIRIAEPPKKPRDESITNLQLRKVDVGTGMTESEIREAYAKNLRRIVELAGLPDSYVAPGSRLLKAYHWRLTKQGGAYNYVSFDFSKTGALTATYASAMMGFNGQDVLTEKHNDPTLEFGVFR